MTVEEFKKMLERDGYREIATRTREPEPANAEHAHEFTARGLVTDGEFIITCEGVERSYRAGEMFEVAAGTRHTEAVGAQGACVTSGRKY